MVQYSQLRERASQLLREFAANGPVLVLAAERAAADEVVRLACTKALLGVQRLGFRELAPEIAADERNRLGARAAAELRPSPSEDQPSTSLESLQRFPFSAAAVPQRSDDGTVEIFSTSGEALECVEIARRIVQAAVPFDEIAILLRSPERHQPLVIEALRRAGIPAHCTHGTARPDVAGRSFLALLNCRGEGLSASRFAEYLSLGQMRGDEEPHTLAL